MLRLTRPLRIPLHNSVRILHFHVCVCVCATALALQNMRCSTKNPIQLIFKCALRTRQDIGIHYLSILHMAKKGSDYKKQWEAKPRNAESAES